MNVEIANTGAGPLVRAVVSPCIRANLSVRATFVRINDTGGGRRVMTGGRLRTNHLVVPHTTATALYYTAVKDGFNMWSEVRGSYSFACPNFTAGNHQRSIGGLHDDDLSIEEPCFSFPDLSIGSGRMFVCKTLINDAFMDEERRAEQADPIAAFTISLVDLDNDQVRTLHAFAARASNAGLKPFYFDYGDESGETAHADRYIVRFRDAEVAEELARHTYSSCSFSLVEVLTDHAGGDV